MKLAKNLRYLRRKNGFSQDDIAGRLGYKSYTTIQKWEMGASEPPIGMLKQLSIIYNVDIETMVSVDIETGERKSDFISVPIIGTIAAGTPIFAEQNIEDYFHVDKRIKADFALSIKGHSMIGAGINNGDIAFFRQQKTLENGEIGAILIENEATVKKFYRANGTVILQPENSQYDSMVFTNGEINILGKLVAVFQIKY